MVTKRRGGGGGKMGWGWADKGVKIGKEVYLPKE